MTTPVKPKGRRGMAFGFMCVALSISLWSLTKNFFIEVGTWSNDDFPGFEAISISVLLFMLGALVGGFSLIRWIDYRRLLAVQEYHISSKEQEEVRADALKIRQEKLLLPAIKKGEA